ncbi:MAG: DUF5522 domain-containing protein [Saprospiraceae bacterium]|jgi:hypothetical protein|nr:DUF5522 domain-containing protein [Saprospiraceae bacterium]
MKQEAIKKPNQPVKLVEGLDYVVENGLFVLTKKYLANRGYCCKNGCRNCPYGFEKVKES